jgi:hypothetical protein
MTEFIMKSINTTEFVMVSIIMTVCHGVNKYDRVFRDVNKHDRDCHSTDTYTEIYWCILNSANTFVVYIVTAQY